jgi:para-aminobenzoate synthetase component 1
LTTLGVPALALGTYPYPRQSPLAAHKTLNYLYYARAGQWARENGFHEALITNPDGTISETNTANLLMICENTVVCPTSDAVLPGVMQQVACPRLRKMGFTVVSRAVKAAELLRADGVFITNALMGAAPIHSIDKNHLPDASRLCRELNRVLGIRP